MIVVSYSGMGVVGLALVARVVSRHGSFGSVVSEALLLALVAAGLRVGLLAVARGRGALGGWWGARLCGGARNGRGRTKYLATGHIGQEDML